MTATILSKGFNGSPAPLSFGPGFNVVGGSVQFALDDPSNMLWDPSFEGLPALQQWTQAGGAWSVDSVIFFLGAAAAKGTVSASTL